MRDETFDQYCKRQDRNDKIIFGGIGLTLVGFVALAAVVAVHEGERWQAFAAEHHCKVVGRMSDSLATTVGPVVGGQGGMAVGVTVVPGKTGYACDDGVTYWR